MKLTKWLRQDSNNLALSATTVAAIIDISPAVYNLTAANATEMTDAADALTTANSEVDATLRAWKSAVQTREEARTALIETFGTYLNLCYASPNVTNAELEEIGLDARSSGSSPVVPSDPLDFIANPFADGHVDLRWKRNGNPYSVSFVIEQFKGDAWVQIGTTTKSRLTLFGYTPGVAATFRVFATRNGEVSNPSNTFTIYEEGSFTALSLAA